MKRFAPLVALAVWLAPAVALACPVCFDANETNRDAFIATTVILSLLPLAMIGGLALFLRSRARSAEKTAETEASPLEARG